MEGLCDKNGGGLKNEKCGSEKVRNERIKSEGIKWFFFFTF